MLSEFRQYFFSPTGVKRAVLIPFQQHLWNLLNFINSEKPLAPSTGITDLTLSAM
jgi:hypothetical protein